MKKSHVNIVIRNTLNAFIKSKMSVNILHKWWLKLPTNIFTNFWVDTFTNSQWIHLPTRKYTKYSVDKYSHCWVDEINRAVEFAPTPVRVLLLNRAGRIDFQGTVGTPHLKIEGLVKGLFPIETNPGELTDISPDKIFLEGHGLLISGLPYHLMVNERTRNYLPKQEREFMKETDKKRKWVNREQFSKLEWFEEYTPEYNTCEGFKEEKRRELKEREREIDLEYWKRDEEAREEKRSQ